MAAKKSLYDILEVSPSASDDTIKAAFERFTKKFEQKTLTPPHGLGLDTYYSVLLDAYRTLSVPEKRKAYDARQNQLSAAQASSSDYYDAPSGMSFAMKAVIVIGILAGGAYYYKSQSDAEIEKTRLIAEAKKAQLEALDREKEIAEREALQRDRQIGATENSKTRQEYEAARRDAERTSEQLRRNEEQARRDEERKRYEEERKRAEEQRRNEQRAEAERQKVIRDASRLRF